MKHLLTASAVLGRPGADSVVIDHGRITAVGVAAELLEPGLSHEVHEGVILGALRDAHLHPSGYAAAVTGLSVFDARDFADLRDRIVEAALELPPGVPIVANRLDEHQLREGRLPTARDLDRVLVNRPVFVIRYCGHVAIGNTSALRRAGLTAGTPDPPGGTIDRSSDGAPTGVLRETAVGLVSSALSTDIPTPGPDRLLAAVGGLSGLGITRIHAIVSTGTAMWCGSGSELEDLLEIAPSLPIAADCFVTASSPAELDRAVDRIAHAEGSIGWAGLKLFADGSLGGFTAAMEEHYSDGPGSGTLRLDPSTAAVMAEATFDLGGSVAVHAIGDRANRAALDLFRSLKGGWADPARYRVEHASVLSPTLVAAFAETGVTASVQPPFIASEANWLEDRVGADRARWTYPLRSLAEAGVKLVGGSDAPVEDPNPWKAMVAACDNHLTPIESIDRQTALDIYGSAPIAVGGQADLLVIDRNPITTDDLAATQVLVTFVRGERVEIAPTPWPG